MNKETELALKQLYDKYTMIQLTLFCLTEKRTGKWLSKKKDGTIYINDLEDVKIIEDSNGKLRAVQMSNDYSCPIEDGKIIDIINELRPKKKATPKNYKGVTYMDVFRRVLDIMDSKTGYTPNDEEIEDEENGDVDICIDYDGNEHKTWTNAKAFVGGDPDEESIFQVVADLDDIYDKLASRWDAEFCDSCRILGKVDVKDNSPAGIMKALDKAGL